VDVERTSLTRRCGVAVEQATIDRRGLFAGVDHAEERAAITAKAGVIPAEDHATIRVGRVPAAVDIDGARVAAGSHLMLPGRGDHRALGGSIEIASVARRHIVGESGVVYVEIGIERRDCTPIRGHVLLKDRANDGRFQSTVDRDGAAAHVGAEELCFVVDEDAVDNQEDSIPQLNGAAVTIIEAL